MLPKGTVPISLAILAACCGCGASHGKETGNAAALRVMAGVPPLGWLVERIGGADVAVGVLVEPGQNPHVFQPSPRQAAAVEKASLFFKIGLPFEAELVRRIESHGGRTKVIDAARGVVRRQLEEEEEGGPDPHVWLSPRNLQIIAANVAAALSEASPGRAAEFRGRLATLDAELDRLDARLRRELAPYRGQTFYVFHPAFGYFADAYGLVQKSVETEGKPPTPRRLRALVKQARAEGVKVIFFQPQFDVRAAGVVAEAIGGAAAPIDSLGADAEKNIDEIATKIRESLWQEACASGPHLPPGATNVRSAPGGEGR